ncbi:MAG: hypothetical protein RLZZ196_1408 [Bacteroidota bacterium]|jgi:hypothetical protein
MTIYNVTAVLGTTYVSELIELNTNLSPEDELQLAEDTLLDKWNDLFNYDFITLPDEVTSFAIGKNDDK